MQKIFLLIYGGEVFILDHSALSMFQCNVKFWEGVLRYSRNYRVIGSSYKETDETPNLVLKSGKDWIVKVMEKTYFNTAVARSMKQSLALLENEFHDLKERYSLGGEKRSAAIREQIAGILPMAKYWHGEISTWTCTDRMRMGFSYLYYGLPAPD